MNNNNERNEDLKIEPPRKGCLGRAGCVTAVVIGLLFSGVIYRVCLYAPPLRIAEDTTRITGPLTADGDIDFFRYFEELTTPPEMKTDENGYRIYIRTFGDDFGIDPPKPYDAFYHDQRYEKLGLDPTEAPTMTMPMEPFVFLKQRLEAEGVPLESGQKSVFHKPWTLDDWPQMADWIGEIDAPLDAAAEMIRKPVFHLPMLQSPESYHSGKPQILLEMLLPDLMAVREIARRYQARANYRVVNGDIDGAVEDAITLYHLAAKLRRGSMIQLLVTMAIEGIGHGIPFETAADHPLTKEQIQRLLDALPVLDGGPDLAVSLEGERVMGLSAMQGGFNGTSRDFGVMYSARNRTDQNIAYAYMNRMYDAVSSADDDGVLDELKSPLTISAMILGKITPSYRGMMFGRILSALMIPSAKTAEFALNRSKCSRQLRRVSLALRLYRLEHGDWPGEDWQAAIRPYLGEHAETIFVCPGCVPDGNGTNYFFVRYDAMPESRAVPLVVDLPEPLEGGATVISPEDLLGRLDKIKPWLGDTLPHPGVVNMALHDGSVVGFGLSDWQELRERIFPTPQTEANENDGR